MPIEWLPIKNAGNFADRIIYSNCARPWWVYVETFFPAYLRLAIRLSFPDINDLIRWRAYQIAGEGKPGSHFRKRKVTGREPQHKRYSMDGLKWLLIVTEPLELIGFTWLLFSSVDEFFLDWMTLIEQSEYCNDLPEVGSFHRSRENFPTVISPLGAEVFLTTLESNTRNWNNTATELQWPAGNFDVIFACKLSSILGEVDGVSACISIDTPFGERFWYSPKVKLNRFQETTVLLEVKWHRAAFGDQRLRWRIAGPPVLAGVFVHEADLIAIKVS